jgi:hypothetical protein
MFEAYKIGVKISLINNASLGLLALSKDFMRTEADAAKLEARIASIQKLALKGGFMLGIGASGLALFKGPLEEAKKFQVEMERFKALGVGDAVSADAINFAKGMNTYGTSMRENLGLLRDAQSIFGNIDHAKFVAPLMAKMKFANSALFGEEGGAMRDKSFMDMLKVVELRRGLVSEAAFTKQANMIQQVQTATGGRVQANEYLNFIKTGGVAAKAMRDDVFYYKMEPLIQEMGGNRIGTGLMSAYQNLYQGRTTVRAANELMNYGLIDPKMVEFNKIGMVKQIKPGALKNGEQFTADPVKWLEGTLLPALAAKGVTKEQDVLNTIGAIFSNRTASQLFSTMFLQMDNIKKNEAMNRKADDIGTLDRRARETLSGEQIVLHAKWRDLMLVVGKTVLPLAIKGVEWLTKAITDLTGWAKRNEGAVKLLTIAFAALAGGLAIRGTILLLTAAFQGLGGALAFQAIGGAAGLTSIAGSIMTFGRSLITMSATVMTNPYVLAVLGAGASGYAVGTGINAGINWGVRKLTGNKNQNLGGWIYDATHKDSPYVTVISGKPVQVTTQIKIDGRKVAEAVSHHQAKAASKPFAGASSFDYGMAAPPVGMGYAR